MARFMVPEMDKQINRRKKGLYINPTDEYRILSYVDENNALIARYRFHREGIIFITNLITNDLEQTDKRGNPVPHEIQVNIFFVP